MLIFDFAGPILILTITVDSEFFITLAPISYLNYIKISAQANPGKKSYSTFCTAHNSDFRSKMVIFKGEFGIKIFNFQFSVKILRISG